MASQKIAVAWFAREDYSRIRALSDDRDEIYERYDDWLEKIGPKIANLERRLGVICEKITIRPDDLQAWARSQGRPIDADTRAVFAAVRMAARQAN